MKWNRALFAALVLALVGCGGGAPTAAPGAPMTGAQWLTLPFADQVAIVINDEDAMRCPHAVRADTIAVRVMQAAATPYGRTERVSDLLSAALAAGGCVQG